LGFSLFCHPFGVLIREETTGSFAALSHPWLGAVAASRLGNGRVARATRCASAKSNVRLLEASCKIHPNLIAEFGFKGKLFFYFFYCIRKPPWFSAGKPFFSTADAFNSNTTCQRSFSLFGDGHKDNGATSFDAAADHMSVHMRVFDLQNRMRFARHIYFPASCP
jgi:hypothetical protein